MALLVDNEAATNGALKHFCRICKKGFGCGRALGGHMRAHGIGGDDSSGNHIDDDDDDTTNNDDWPDDSDKAAPSSKRMYALRANPNNRLRSSRACENCGKEFLSWKSFLEHGKCVSDDADSLVSSSPPDSGGGGGRGGGNWSKRKRSFRAKVGNLNPVGQICPSSEEEDLANCLMMLSNAAVDPTAEPEESCASASRDELIDQHPRRNNNNNNNNAAMALNHFNISPISFRVPDNNNTNNNYINNNNNKILGKGVHNNINIHNNNSNNNKGLFECKACKKVFNSHQALGGHRASHKKVKGCFAARLDAHDETLSAAAEDDASADDPQSFPPATATTNHNSNNLNNSSLIAAVEHVGPAKRKSKVHECSICHRIFSSGQALGGHKRCHWITSNSAAAVSAAAAGPGAEATAALAKFQQFQESIEQINLAAAAAAAAATIAAQQHASNTNIKATAAAAAASPTVANSGLDLKLDLNLPANNNENVSTEIFLQPWIGSPMGTKHDQRDDHERDNRIPSDVDDVVVDQADHQCNAKKSTGVNSVALSAVMEDEADSTVKLARLSELKDMNVSEGSSWLQVGIGSTTDVGSTVP